MNRRRRVGIIGGGPAGLMAAVIAAQNGADVTIFERNDRIGKKILATGNGKCNYSNEYLTTDFYEGSVKEIFRDVFSQYDNRWIKSFLKSNGVLTKEKNGYLYPNTEQASTMVDLFRNLICAHQIEVIYGQCITPKQILTDEKVFRICLLNRRNYEYDSLIICTGGMAAPKTGSDGNGFLLAKHFGHHIVECVPALVQLRCSNLSCKALAGVRADARLDLYIDDSLKTTEAGELQLTDYGISGIPVFQLSRHVGYALKEQEKVKVAADFLKDYEKKELVTWLSDKRNRMRAEVSSDALTDMTYEDFFNGIVHKKITHVLLKECGFKPTESVNTLSNNKIKDFVTKAKHYEFYVTATNSFEQAQVSAGGIPVSEINPDLSSKFQKRLYFAGEILDIDGKCGGYNLQWAFSSGAVAGKHAAS